LDGPAPMRPAARQRSDSDSNPVAPAAPVESGVAAAAIPVPVQELPPFAPVAPPLDVGREQHADTAPPAGPRTHELKDDSPA
jgi:hypothetical protein